MRIDNKWDGLRLEIIQYCKDNNISENDFTFLNIHQWENVYNRLLKSFVDARYAKNNGLHWSNTEGGFRKDINRIYTFVEGDDKHYSYEWIEKISDIVKCEKVYIFLLEEKQRLKYWIAECNPKVIHLIINNAVSPTDYYITNKQFNWLITENHHDVVQFLGKGLDLNDIESVCVK